MSEVIMVVGCPASGKGTLSKKYIDQGYIHLNRDKEGGKVTSLVPKMEQCLRDGKNVVLDNTFPTIESRASFIEAASRNNSDISCITMGTSIEDAQINALFRMHDRYGKIFFTVKDIRDSKVNDPNMFPPAALFKYRKDFQKPKTDEGFQSVTTEQFIRKSKGYKNKAVLLDYDGTLREVQNGTKKFPTRVEEVKMLPGRREVLEQMKKDGYLLLGVSNQSGIAKGDLSDQTAIDCFQFTNDQLGLDIDFHYCPHAVPPVSCYCRKPQAGLGVLLIEKYKLNPSQCIMVGDSTSDKTFAKRLGFVYSDQYEFFK